MDKGQLMTTPFIIVVSKLIPHLSNYNISICNKYDSSVYHVDTCPDLENHLIGRILCISSRITTLEVNLTTMTFVFRALCAENILGAVSQDELEYLKRYLF